jgi:glycosyltransferase involved in cell wall biosynthesis
MNILIVSQVFYPENFKINSLCKFLIDKGHKLTIITGKPNYPEGNFYKNYGLFSKVKSEYYGAKIYRLPIVSRGNGSNLRLALNYLSFALVGSIFAMFLRKKFDFSFVFGVSPIVSAFPAIIHKFFYKTKFYLWVLDLWPESVLVTKRTNSNLIINFLKFLVKFIYKKTDKIFISSKYMKSSISKYLKKPQSFDIEHFPNWINESYLDFNTNNHKFKKLIPKGFIIMLAGNLGYSIDYPNIIKTAIQLTNYKQIKFLIIGSGSEENLFKCEVKNNNLENKFYFLGRHPSYEMPNFYCHADLMLITLADEEIYSYTVPEKLQSYMVMKKPIIGMINGETNHLINESNSGISVKSGDYKNLAKQIVKLYKLSKNEMDLLGKNGYKFAIKNFSLSININKVLN